MKSIYGVLIIFLISINLLKAQKQCQTPNYAASELNVNFLIGKWFVVKSFGENFGKCSTLNIELKNLTTSEISYNITEMKLPALEYSVIGNKTDSILTIDETSLNTLNIIESDYKNFVLIHYCNGDITNVEEKIWILSKTRKLSETLNTSIMKRFKNLFPNINLTSNYQSESV